MTQSRLDRVTSQSGLAVGVLALSVGGAGSDRAVSVVSSVMVLLPLLQAMLMKWLESPAPRDARLMRRGTWFRRALIGVVVLVTFGVILTGLGHATVALFSRREILVTLGLVFVTLAFCQIVGPFGGSQTS